MFIDPRFRGFFGAYKSASVYVDFLRLYVLWTLPGFLFIAAFFLALCCFCSSPFEYALSGGGCSVVGLSPFVGVLSVGASGWLYSFISWS